MAPSKKSAKHRKKRAPAVQLPDKVLAMIFSFLDPFELLGCGATRVCRQWHQVLEEEPRLWQHVVADLPGCRHPGHDHDKGPVLRQLKYILARSGDLPLYLRIHGVDRRDQILYMIQRNIHRIRSLKIMLTGKGSHVKHFIAHLVWPAPILECFELTYDIHEMHVRTTVPVGIFAGQAPRLRRLALDLTFSIDQPVPAFASVTSFSCAPDPVHPDYTAKCLPSLRHVMFGGAPENLHWLPGNGFGPGTLREIEFDFLVAPRDHVFDNPMVPSLLEFSRVAYASGITRLTYRCASPGDQIFLTTRFQQLLGPITALEMTFGGYAFQEVFDVIELGLGLKCSDASGRSFEIATPAHAPLPSWKALSLGVFHGLTRFSFCEKTMPVLQDSRLRALPIPMPQLRELSVFVVPTSLRNSSALFDIKGFRAPSMGPKIIQAPLLETLSFLRNPARPWWGGHWHGAQTIKTYCPIDGEPCDVSAKSVSSFIRTRLGYSASLLARVSINRDITLSEGFHSPPADAIRSLTESLEYV
ncbi:hypothetical protein AURDEDRAFT_187578 [Auricularia subglabra TFB-10046 SS5]|nr:hypothetical protein AURDEDRAFT_187578 [Auricularia subglabra TFB-10046 SS5]